MHYLDTKQTALLLMIAPALLAPVAATSLAAVSVSVCITGVAGDVTCDCTVNVIDLAMIGIAFGSRPGSPNWNGRADLNNDSVINVIDLAIVGSSFGRTC